MARSERTYLWTSHFFRDLVADRIRFALTRYFSRKAQISDIPYAPDILKSGFPVPRDFALAFYAENPLKSGESRKIKLKINGNHYDAFCQPPSPDREYWITFDAEGDVANRFNQQGRRNRLWTNCKPD